MIDKLSDIFKRQLIQDTTWFDLTRFNTDQEYRIQVVKERILNIFDQSGKLLNNFNWKTHKGDIEENIMNALEQLVDISKFSLGLFGLLKPEETTKIFYELFDGKTKLVDDRHRQSKIKFFDGDKVVIFDIDGVIADYDTAFLQYAKECGYEPVNKIRSTYNYSEHFGISKCELENIIKAFTVEGKFRTIKAFNDVVKYLDNINFYTGGTVKIVLLTARPSWEYSRIELDTFYWLNKYQIPYSKIIYDKDKSDAIIRNIHPANPLFIVDDRDKHAVELSHLGHPVYLIDKEYNQDFDVTNFKNITRIKSINEIKVSV